MNQEKVFWQRVLQLAQSTLKQTAYDFFVSDAVLIEVKDSKAHIYLDSPFKKVILGGKSKRCHSNSWF